jgi:chromosome partitioning protein
MRLRRRDRDQPQPEPETQAGDHFLEGPGPEAEVEEAERSEASQPEPEAETQGPADLSVEASSTVEGAVEPANVDSVITGAESADSPVDFILEPPAPEPEQVQSPSSEAVIIIPPLPTDPARAEPPLADPVLAEVVVEEPADPVLAEVVVEEPAEEPAVPVVTPDPARSGNQENFAERAQAAMSRLGELPGSNGVHKPRPLPRVVAIANQKGGVGKTTTTVNLGAALSELDYRVLVVDLDPQGNATSGLGIDTRNFESSMYDVIMRDAPIEDCIEPTSVQNLFVTPATIDLAGVEIELVSAFSRELKLKRAIDTVVDDFDFVLIDCPPSLGLLTVNGLAAATEVLVPIQCEYYALEGLSQLLRNVQLVAANLNVGLEISAIVLTMFDARTRLAVDVADEVRSHFKEIVCRSIIPRTVRLSEAPSFGQPITVFDPSSRGAIAYRELAKEVSDGAPKRSG